MQPIELGGNDYEYSFPLYEYDEETGKKAAAEGVLDLVVWISATDGGAAIDPSLSVDASERVAALGNYWVRWSGGDLDAHLDEGKYFIVISNGPVITLSVPIRVRAVRRS